MKKFRIFRISNMWSSSNLVREVENELTKLTKEGYEIVSVSFGTNIWYVPTAYITTTM